jgi:gamma-glutamylcyclotransferase (GGCT)/AIG2-like uncharacterized protein YtfP
VSNKKPKGNLVWVFVYGTLRPGDYNSRMLGDVDVIRGCEVHGWAMHNLTEDADPVYPVCVPTNDPNDVVKGDLLLMDNESPEYHRIYRMEIGAGYKLSVVEVIIPADEDSVDAFIFEYRHSTEDRYYIESGDWFEFTGRKVGR